MSSIYGHARCFVARDVGAAERIPVDNNLRTSGAIHVNAAVPSGSSAIGKLSGRSQKERVTSVWPVIRELSGGHMYETATNRQLG
jgi:hypothetical protein